MSETDTVGAYTQQETACKILWQRLFEHVISSWHFIFTMVTLLHSKKKRHHTIYTDPYLQNKWQKRKLDTVTFMSRH